MKYYKGNIKSLPDNGVFVFGSNLQGIHGAGAAKVARAKYGAKIGVGFGISGKSYAIPTKETPYITMQLEAIHSYVVLFGFDAELNPNYNFYITQLGCGLAGYNPAQIAPMFKHIDYDNCYYSEEWREYLEN
jgi:hypothetical protein